MQDAIRTFRVFAYIVLVIALFLAVVSGDTYFGIKFLARFGLQTTRHNNELFCVSVVVAVILGFGLWSWRAAVVVPFFFVFPLLFKSLERELVVQIPMPKGSDFLVPYANHILIAYCIVVAILALFAGVKRTNSPSG